MHLKAMNHYYVLNRLTHRNEETIGYGDVLVEGFAVVVRRGGFGRGSVIGGFRIR